MDVEIFGFVQFLVVPLQEPEAFLDDPIVQLLVQAVLRLLEPVIPKAGFLLFLAAPAHVAGALHQGVDDVFGDCLFQLVVDVLDHGVEGVFDEVVPGVLHHAVEGA